VIPTINLANSLTIGGNSSLIVGTKWNSADKTTNAVLSGSDYVVTANNSTYEFARTVRNNLTLDGGGGKFYCECLVGTVTGGDCFFGLLLTANTITSGANAFGGANTYAAWRNSGTTVQNNITNNAIALPWIAGSILGLAIDGVNNKVWVSLDGSYPIAGDPVAGTNPVWFSFPSGSFAVVFGTDNNAGSDELTLKTSTADLTYTPPAGFTAGLP